MENSYSAWKNNRDNHKSNDKGAVKKAGNLCAETSKHHIKTLFSDAQGRLFSQSLLRAIYTDREERFHFYVPLFAGPQDALMAREASIRRRGGRGAEL